MRHRLFVCCLLPCRRFHPVDIAYALRHDFKRFALVRLMVVAAIRLRREVDETVILTIIFAPEYCRQPYDVAYVTMPTGVHDITAVHHRRYQDTTSPSATPSFCPW